MVEGEQKNTVTEKELQKLNILNCSKWEVDWQYKVSSFTQMYVKYLLNILPLFYC